MGFSARQVFAILLWAIAGIFVASRMEMQYVNPGKVPHDVSFRPGYTARKAMAVSVNEQDSTHVDPSGVDNQQLEREMRSMILGGLGGVAVALLGIKAPGMTGPMIKSIHRMEVVAARVVSQAHVAELGAPTAALAAVTAARLPSGVVELSNRREKGRRENTLTTPRPKALGNPNPVITKTEIVEQKNEVAEVEFLTELVVGNAYESVCDQQKWWRVIVTEMNADGSYSGYLDNAKKTAWSEIWAENCRHCMNEDAVVAMDAGATGMQVDDGALQKDVTERMQKGTSLNSEVVEHMMVEAVGAEAAKNVDWNNVEKKKIHKFNWIMA